MVSLSKSDICMRERWQRWKKWRGWLWRARVVEDLLEVWMK